MKIFNFIEHVCKGTCMAVLTWKSEHGLLVAAGLPILPCGFWVIELRSLALAVAREVILSAHRTFVHFFNFVWKSTQTKTHSFCCIRVNTYKTPLKLIKTEYFQSPPKGHSQSLSHLCSIPKGTHLLIFAETTLLMLFVPDTCFAFWTLQSKLDVLWCLMTSAQHYSRHPFHRVAMVYLFSGLYIAFLWEYITAWPTQPLPSF